MKMIKERNYYLTQKPKELTDDIIEKIKETLFGDSEVTYDSRQCLFALGRKGREVLINPNSDSKLTIKIIWVANPLFEPDYRINVTGVEDNLDYYKKIEAILGLEGE